MSISADAIQQDQASSLFVPSVHTTRKLRQYGLSRGQISDLLSSYSEQDKPCSDAGFSRYALQAKKSILRTITTLPPGWHPSSHVIVELQASGLPSSVQREYLERYQEQYACRQIEQASWDDHFLCVCHKMWAQDSRNEMAVNGTLIAANWEPSGDTLKQLDAEGIDRNWLEILALEYRLYWRQVGKKKVNWNTQFLWWARKKWRDNRI